MHDHDLAQDIFEQLKILADNNAYRWVTRVEMVVGSKHGATAAALTQNLTASFEGTNFEDAAIDIRIVEPMEELKAPGRADMMTANGWEILVTRLEGRK